MYMCYIHDDFLGYSLWKVGSKIMNAIKMFKYLTLILSASMAWLSIFNLVLWPYWPAHCSSFMTFALFNFKTSFTVFVFLVLILPIFRRPAQIHFLRVLLQVLPHPKYTLSSRDMPAFWPQKASTMFSLALEFIVFLLSSLSLTLKNLEGIGHMIFIFVTCDGLIVHSIFSINMS